MKSVELRLSDQCTVILECGHLTTAQVNHVLHNETFDCYACQRPVKWVDFRGMLQGWYFRCVNCRYARSYGDARLMCETKAYKHSNKRHHDLAFGVDGVHVKMIRFERQQPTLDGQPPF